MCVMYRLTLTAKVNPGGVSDTQRATLAACSQRPSSAAGVVSLVGEQRATRRRRGQLRLVRIGPSCDSCRKPRKLLDNPVLEVFRDHVFGLDGLVTRSDQEERRMLAYAGVS